jgi:phage protein D/phage baseplate assembly protein gpV
MKQVEGLPDLELTVDGATLDVAATSGLAEVQVHAALSVPTQFELVFDDPGLALAEKLPPGARVEVKLSSHELPLVTGEITACEYVYAPDRRNQLRVRGYEVLHQLRRRRPLRAHTEVTVVDLARDMASAIGLTVRCDASPPAWPFLIQGRQSDLDLLVDLAGRCGLYLAQHGDELLLITLEGTGAPVPLALGEQLLEARFEVNGEWACNEVQVSGWNPFEVREVSASASDAHVALSAEARVDPARLGGDGVYALVDESVQSDDHARALAQAELDSRAAHQVALTGVAKGDPALRPGTIVELAEVHAHVKGKYVVSEVHHSVDGRRGFLSEISSVPPARRPRPAGAIVALGRVSKVDDPSGLGRVRVKLPAWGGVETDWMGVLSLGAGKKKGLTILPNVDDTVLVQLFREDPGRGVVLGGLFGGDGSPDAGVEGGSVQRFSLATAGGHRITFDDKKETLRVQDKAGSYLELSPETVTLHAKHKMVLEAPGQGVIIRGKTVDFEQK